MLPQVLKFCKAYAVQTKKKGGKERDFQLREASNTGQMNFKKHQ